MNLTITSTLFPNFTAPNCSENCTSSGTADEPVEGFTEQLKLAEIIILSIILIISLCGNILLISAITKFRHLRNVPNYLILNLACCDILTALFSIPFMLIRRNSDSYPFYEIGCKALQPLATYSSNASVFTLVCIAIERYLAISGSRIVLTKMRVCLMLLLVHIAALCSAAPYSHHLTYELYKGVYYCYEDWIGTPHQKSYTITLFLLQYGLPLPIMTVLYSTAWWKIKQQNKKMIELSEEYEKKMNWEVKEGMKEHDIGQTMKKTAVTFDEEARQSLVSIASEERENEDGHDLTNGDITVDRRGSEPVIGSPISSKPFGTKRCSLPFGSPPPDLKYNVNDNNVEKSRQGRRFFVGTFKRIDTVDIIRQKIKHFRKPTYISHTAYVRHRQTVRMLKMFTVIVVVFLIFALPNQIIWLVNDFAPPDKHPPLVLTFVFNILPYVNSMINCWIYGGFNKAFRKAYKQILLSVFTCKKIQMYTFKNRARAANPSSCISTATESSYYDSTQQERFEIRHNAFSDMFEQHLNNFEKFKHLYHFEDDEEKEEEVALVQQPQKKRKVTLSNLLHALTPSSRRASSLSLSSQQPSSKTTSPRKLSMIPPIIPFTQASVASTNRRRRASTSEIGACRVNTHDFFDSSLNNNIESSKSPIPSRKTSVWAMLTSPKLFNKKVQKRTLESEIPTVKIINDEVAVEEMALVQSVDLQAHTVHSARKISIRQPVIYTKISQNKVKKQPSPRMQIKTAQKQQCQIAYDRTYLPTNENQRGGNNDEYVKNERNRKFNKNNKIVNKTELITATETMENTDRKLPKTVTGHTKGKPHRKNAIPTQVVRYHQDSSSPNLQRKTNKLLEQRNNEIVSPRTRRRRSIKALIEDELVAKRTAMLLSPPQAVTNHSQKNNIANNNIESPRQRKQSQIKKFENMLNAIKETEEEKDTLHRRSTISAPNTPQKQLDQENKNGTVSVVEKYALSPPKFVRKTSLTAHVFDRTGANM